MACVPRYTSGAGRSGCTCAVFSGAGLSGGGGGAPLAGGGMAGALAAQKYLNSASSAFSPPFFFGTEAGKVFFADDLGHSAEVHTYSHSPRGAIRPRSQRHTVQRIKLSCQRVPIFSFMIFLTSGHLLSFPHCFFLRPQVQTLSSCVDTLLFYEGKSRLVIITRALLLVQLQVRYSRTGSSPRPP